MNRFITLDRDTDSLFPPSMSDWLPDDHLARFVVDVVDLLELSTLRYEIALKPSVLGPFCARRY